MLSLITAAFFALQGPPRPADVPVTIRMIDGGASETAAVADLNRDGRLDIISGEYWYQAPTWAKHKFREVGFSGNYIDSFSLMPVGVNGDGYPDLVDVSWFARKASAMAMSTRMGATTFSHREVGSKHLPMCGRRVTGRITQRGNR